LHNLVKNAFEAIGEQGHGWIRLTTKLQSDDDCPKILLRVEDSGAGIPEEMLAQVFEPYVSSKVKGSGLGLAIVKKIVEEHGGQVRVYNGAEGGACIDILFPVEDADLPPVDAGGGDLDAHDMTEKQ
jgi:nitrogen fixation/metabolism regulation signal transduction histidine kinase